MQAQIFRIIEENCFGLFAVTSSASDLLVVGIDRITDLIMIHKAYIAFVDAHAERSSRDNNLKLVVHKRLLRLLTILCPHASMIGSCFYALLAEGLSQLFCMFACGC